MSTTDTQTAAKNVTPMAATAASTTPPALNKDLSITNSSSVDVAMLDGVANGDNQVVFEQSLKLLPTTDNQQFIKAGGTGTVILDDYHDNAGVSTYSKLYDIIYVKPSNLYPIKSQGAILNHTTQAYAPVTVTDNEVNGIKQAEAFTQTIMAYPTSQLAKDYAAALQTTSDSGSSSDDIDDKVSAFFTSTQQYKLVTLDMLMALKSYYNTFPMVWAGYTAAKSFYFYSSDGTNVTYNGSIAISVPTAVKPDKTLPGFTFTFTDANNAAKPLYYANGQFVDDLNADVPAICLTGLFTLKSTLTKVATDNTIVPILSGTINSTQVLGYDTKIEKDKDGNWSGLYTLLHPKDMQGWLQLFMTFIGIVMGIDFLSKGLKSLKDKLLDEKAETGNDPSPADVANAKSEVKASEGLNDPQYQELLDKMDANLKVTQDVQQQLNDTQKQLQDRLNEDQRSALDDQMTNQESMLEKMLDSGHNTGDLQDLDDTLGDNWDALDGASTDDLGSILSDLKQQISDLSAKIDVQYETISEKMKGEAKDTLDEAKTEADAANEAADKIGDDAKDAENGDVPEDAEFETTGIEG